MLEVIEKDFGWGLLFDVFFKKCRLVFDWIGYGVNVNVVKWLWEGLFVF